MRRWKVVAAGAGAILVVAILVLCFVPPAIARGDLARIGTKIDACVEAGSVSGVPGRVTFRGFSATPRGLSAPLVTVERIDVHYSVIALLWGSTRPTRIDVVRPTVRADLSTPEAVRALAALANRLRSPRPAQASSADAVHPVVVVRRGSFALVDRRGAAVAIRRIEAMLADTGTAAVSLSHVSVGAVPEDPWLVLERLAVGLSLPAHRLTRVSLEGGSVRVRRHGDGSVEAAEVFARLLALREEILGTAEPTEPAHATSLPALRFAALTLAVDDQARGRRSQVGPLSGSLTPLGRLTAAEVSLEAPLGEGRATVTGTIDALGGAGDVQIEMDRAALGPLVALAPPPDALGLDDAVVTGSLHVAGDRAGGEIGLEGSVEVSKVDVRAPELATAPLDDVTLGFDGRVRVRAEPDEWAIPEARVAINGVDARVRGGVLFAAGTAERATLDFSLPPTPCDALLRRLPAPLVSQLSGFRLSGSFGVAVHMRFDRADLDATELDFDVDNRCRIAAATGVDRLRGVFTRTVPDGQGGTRPFTTGPGSETWTPLAEISPHLVQAVLTTEDGGFFRHGGFAPRQIREAFIRDLRSGRFSAGASTISMQLAKNVFLSREKTLSRKLQEAFFTWLLEQSMSKDEILELYLNVIEYGPGVYGVRNAADHFFGVGAAALSPVQAIYLATVLPDPVGRYAQFERGRPWDSTMRRVERIATTMASRGRLDGVSLDEALAEPLLFRGQGPVAEIVGDDEESGTY